MSARPFYEMIYHVEGFTLADAFRPQPGWGTRRFTAKVANLGEHTLEGLVAAAQQQAPARYRLTGVMLYEEGKDAVWLWSIPADPRFAAQPADGVTDTRHQTEAPADGNPKEQAP